MARDISEEGFACLQVAVGMARDRQIRRLTTLKRILAEQGFESSVIDEAVLFWAEYEADKKRIGRAA